MKLISLDKVCCLHYGLKLKVVLHFVLYSMVKFPKDVKKNIYTTKMANIIL